ncbi:MAG: beta-lactamase family protein [Planctomycetes bacterium]|nr:beta-lactamase family protein [Planctomycetota bacterium]
MNRAFFCIVLFLGGQSSFLLRLSDAADNLPRATPESQGISSKAIRDFIESTDATIDGLHSFMLLRNGAVVCECWWEPYGRETRHELYSLSKSFTSTAVGLAITEGRFSLDDEVIKFFPDEAPAEPSRNLRAMRVRDLLMMSTGHQTEPRLIGSDSTWVKVFLAHEVAHKPGAHFMYNTPATYMLSAIVQKQTGETVLEYLRPRLFEPLGIADPTWGTCPNGITLGGYGLNVRTEDIARFGEVYRNEGRVGERQLLPSSWVRQATGRQTSNGSNPQSDWDQGYGFQFWRCRNGCYRGDGAFGQYCIVLPEHHAVIAITAGVKDMQSVLNLIWDKLLPAMQPATLPADGIAVRQLTERLNRLQIPRVKGSKTAADSKKLLGRTYRLSKNNRQLDSLKLELNGNGDLVLAMQVKDTVQNLICGHDTWVKGELAWGGQAKQPVAASGAWIDNHTFAAKICAYETPYCTTLVLKFNEKDLEIEMQTNVSFGPTMQPKITGTPADSL